MPDWEADYARLRAADAASPLPPEELEHLAVAAFLLGHDDELVTLRERAYELYLAQGRTEEAFLCAFWICFHLQNRGAVAQSAGWAARMRRLVPDDPGSRSRALLSARDAAALMMAGSGPAALELFDHAGQVLADHEDLDGFVLCSLGRSRCLEMSGRPAEAADAVDEVMVHVIAGRVNPQITGLAYCVMIDLCLGWYDLPRAREWTSALTSWIDAQRGIVPYRGACLVHRAEILQLRGAWDEAARAAQDAREQLSARPEPLLGDAHYRQGELDRVRGRYADAERSFEAAAVCGAEVQPGLALLRLAKGQAAAAAAGLDRALVDGAGRPMRRPLMLAARVEVALASAEPSVAQRQCDELDAIAAAYSADWIHALADRARGSLLLASGDHRAALPLLRRAWSAWQRLDAPYEAARTRILVGQACAALGDADAARMELDAARTVLTQLGADAEVAPLERRGSDSPLSERECEVLRLIATGATNRAIAEQLVLSEKTIARHVSNIFAKLGLTSRSAATAYAFEHGLS